MLKSFRDLDVFKYSLISQIGEGHGRLTFGERRQFLSQARGSLFEIEAQSFAAVRLRFITGEQQSILRNQIKRAGRALDGLIKYVRSHEKQ